jgi:hypothetical protein
LPIKLVKYLVEELLQEPEWGCMLKDFKRVLNLQQFMEEAKKLWQT